MTDRLSGSASLEPTIFGRKKGVVKLEKKCLSFEGYYLFRVAEDRRVFVEAVTPPVSWWRRLLKSDLEFKNREGAVVARYRDGSSYLVVEGGDAIFEEDRRRGVLTTPFGCISCSEFSEKCEFESRRESLQGIVAIAVHQLYLKLLRAG